MHRKMAPASRVDNTSGLYPGGPVERGMCLEGLVWSGRWQTSI